MSSDKAVILMAYGGAERIDEIPGYLRHIRLFYSRMTGGGEPSKEEVEDLVYRYRMIGGSSPLLRTVRSLSEKLQRHLEEEGFRIRVYYGMKHSKPFISDVFESIVGDGVRDLLGIVLAPHYSIMSVKGYHDALIEANRSHGNPVNIVTVESWHLNPVYIDTLVKRVVTARRRHFGDSGDVYHMFTAHSLPEKIVEWGDPYPTQLRQTVEALAFKLGLTEDEYGFAYQSASSHGEPWLGPSVEDQLERLKSKGWTKVLIVPIGFVSDHLEILYDIDVELKSKAAQLGVKLERTDSYNDSDDFVEVLTSVIAQSGFLATPKEEGATHSRQQ